MVWPVLTLLLLAAPASPEFDSVVGGISDRGHDESCALMERWIAAHPDAADVPRGLLWMARLRLLDGRRDLARPLLERARRTGAGTRWESAAAKEIADLDAAAHRWSEAIAAYDRLAASPDPYWREIGELARAEARKGRALWSIMWGVLFALVAFVAVRAALAIRAGARPLAVPKEALIGAPVAALLMVAALGKEPAELRAVATLAFGGLALLWTNGLALRGKRLSTARRLGEVALAVGQTAALAYCAIVASGLWNKLVDTLRMGAE